MGLLKMMIDVFVAMVTAVIVAGVFAVFVFCQLSENNVVRILKIFAFRFLKLVDEF